MCEKFTQTLSVVCTLYLALKSVAPDSITLFEDKNYKGQRCEIEVVGCKPVCDGLERKASSMQGNATCVHFYREKNCTAYMGSWKNEDGPLPDWKGMAAQDSIVSIGDCFQQMDPKNSIAFYEHKNFRGKRCSIQVKGCKPMCPELDNKASSAQGDAGCAKMFSEANCTGYLGTFDLSEGAYQNFKPTVYQDKITSVGECSLPSQTEVIEDGGR